MHLRVTATILLLVSTTVLVFGRPQDSEKKIEPVVAEVKLESVASATDDTKETVKIADETGKVSSGEAIKEEKPIDDPKPVVVDVVDETTTKENTATVQEEEQKKEIVIIEMATTPAVVVVVASDTSKEPIIESSGESPIQHETIPVQNAETVDNAATPIAKEEVVVAEKTPIAKEEEVAVAENSAAAPIPKEEVAVAEKVDDVTPAAKEEVAAAENSTATPIAKEEVVVAEKVDDATPAAKEEVAVAEKVDDAKPIAKEEVAVAEKVGDAKPIAKEEVAVAEKVDDVSQPPAAPVIPKVAVEQEPSPFVAMWRPYQFECAKESDDFAGDQCADWAYAGYCETNKATKFLFCRKTCLCEGPPKHRLLT